jgi:hypothetical protein
MSGTAAREDHVPQGSRSVLGPHEFEVEADLFGGFTRVSRRRRPSVGRALDGSADPSVPADARLPGGTCRGANRGGA